MTGVQRKVLLGARLLRTHDIGGFLAILRNKIWSSHGAIELRRDLDLPYVTPPARISIRVRPIEPRDFPVLFDVSNPDLSRFDKREIAVRRQMLEVGLATCYAVVTDDDRPCALQWLVRPNGDAMMAQIAGASHIPIAADEVQFEGGFTLPAYRGLNIMPAAKQLILDAERDCGARWATAWVGEGNEPSFRSCARVGLRPYRRSVTTTRFGRFRLTITDLDDAVDATDPPQPPARGIDSTPEPPDTIRLPTTATAC